VLDAEDVAATQVNVLTDDELAVLDGGGDERVSGGGTTIDAKGDAGRAQKARQTGGGNEGV
jgi:hypothetical protein